MISVLCGFNYAIHVNESITMMRLVLDDSTLLSLWACVDMVTAALSDPW